MTSWHLNTWKVYIWLSQEGKELSKWSKKHFSLFHKYSLRHAKQTSKNVADTTFKKYKQAIHYTYFSFSRHYVYIVTDLIKILELRLLTTFIITKN